MSAPAQLPQGLPQGIATQIQQNWLSLDIKEALTAFAKYRLDISEARPLPPQIGETVTYGKLSMFDVDLLPAAPTGAVDLGQFSTEQFSAHPIPYAKGFRLDGPTAYVFRGNLKEQGLGRLLEWAARSDERLARGKLFHYAAESGIVRTQGSSGDTTLFVNSLAPFRYAPIAGGTLQPVSSTNKLAVTIYAATTITGKSVTATSPLNQNFPDGPGTITLDATLGATVAAQSYVKPSNAPYLVRPSSRASTEALINTDKPTLTEILAMRSKLQDRGIMPHRSTGTYHLHVDPYFMPAITQDARWQYATMGSGPSAIDPAALWVKNLGITIFEVNDSPAPGKGNEVSVGSSPGSSVSMQDLGIDVVNSSGVVIRRAIMTGEDAMIETFIPEEQYYTMLGVQKLGAVNENFTVYALNGQPWVSGAVDGWRMNIRPALDDRGISCIFTMSKVLDYTLATDSVNSAVASDTTSLKRAVVCEFGSAT